MTGKTEDAQAVPEGPSEVETVTEYLRRHPGFLVENPDLIVTLTPPDFRRGEDVIDMQKFMLDSLQKYVISLTSRERKLLAVAEDRLAGYGRVQDATLALLGAKTFQGMVRTVTSDLPELLDVQSARLCVEGSLPGPAGKAGMVAIEPHTADRLIGRRRNAVLLNDAADRRDSVGMAKTDVKSLALVRLTLGKEIPAVILVLGAAAADGFHPRQGTDLLTFLSRVLEHCVRRWLSQPAS